MPITKTLRANKYVEDFEELISTESASVNPVNEISEEEQAVESTEKTTNPAEKKKDTFFTFLKDQFFTEYLYRIW